MRVHVCLSMARPETTWSVSSVLSLVSVWASDPKGLARDAGVWPPVICNFALKILNLIKLLDKLALLALQHRKK